MDGEVNNRNARIAQDVKRDRHTRRTASRDRQNTGQHRHRQTQEIDEIDEIDEQHRRTTQTTHRRQTQETDEIEKIDDMRGRG